MKLRKIFSILLTVALVASLTTIFANAEQGTYDLVANGVAGATTGDKPPQSLVDDTWCGPLSGGAGGMSTDLIREKTEEGLHIYSSVSDNASSATQDHALGNYIPLDNLIYANKQYTVTAEVKYYSNSTHNVHTQFGGYDKLWFFYSGDSLDTKMIPDTNGQTQTFTITFTAPADVTNTYLLLGPYAQNAPANAFGGFVPGGDLLIKSCVIEGDLQKVDAPEVNEFTKDETEHDVTATFKAGATAGTTYSVDIEWGALAFTYTGASQGGWNASELKYDGATEGAWAVDTEGGDKITVTNRSNAAVNVEFGYEAKNGYTGVSGTFTYDKTANEGVINLATGEGREVADAVTATLTLSGEIDATGTIGAVKITIAAVEAQG